MPVLGAAAAGEESQDGDGPGGGGYEKQKVAQERDHKSDKSIKKLKECEKLSKGGQAANKRKKSM